MTSDMDGMINVNKKNKYLIIGIIVFVILIVGATYAYMTFAVNVTNGNYISSTTCLDVDYDITNDDGTMPITGEMFPSSSAKGGLSGKVSLKIKDNCYVNGRGTLKLNVSSSNILTSTVAGHCENSKTLQTMTSYTSSSTCTAQTDGKWVANGTALKYAVYDTNNVTDDTAPLSVGYVNKTGSIDIYDDFYLTKTAVNYYVYIWLDGNLSNNSYAGLSFNGNVSSSVEQIDDQYIEYIEYVQSTGTQYIDTGVSVKSNTSIVIDAAFLESTHGDTAQVDTQDYNFIGSYGSKTGLALATYNGKLRFWNTAPQTQVYEYNFNTRYKIVLNDNGEYSVDDTNVVLTAYDVTENLNNIYIFGAQYSGSVGSPFKPGSMKLYGAKIYENGVLVRNMIPAKNSSDTIGLFDLVNSVFYTNAGSGVFIAGPKI